MKCCFIIAATFAGIGVVTCIAIGAYWLSGGNCQEIIDYYKAGGGYYDSDTNSYKIMPANFTCVDHEFPDGGVTAMGWDNTDITCSICQVYQTVGGIVIAYGVVAHGLTAILSLVAACSEPDAVPPAGGGFDGVQVQKG